MQYFCSPGHCPFNSRNAPQCTCLVTVLSRLAGLGWGSHYTIVYLLAIFRFRLKRSLNRLKDHVKSPPMFPQFIHNLKILRHLARRLLSYATQTNLCLGTECSVSRQRPLSVVRRAIVVSPQRQML